MARKRQKSQPSSSDRKQWDSIFNAMVELLQSQQSQLETLADDRKFLEKYIHIQHDHLSSKTRLLQSHIAEIKKEEAKSRKIQESKLELFAAMKQAESSRFKKQYEFAETDVEDFRACVKSLSAELSELKERRKSGEAVECSKDGEQCSAALEAEVKRLKNSYKKLSSKKEAEIAALLSEKDFVWNQIRKMENEYTAIIKAKKAEIQHANEAVAKLQNNLQEQQKSVNEKDEMISNLKARNELDKRRHTEEAEKANEKIEKLQLEIEDVRSLAIDKDRMVDKLRSELEVEKTPSDSNPKRRSRKRVSNSAKDNGEQKQRCLPDRLTGSRASVPVNVEKGRVRTCTLLSVNLDPAYWPTFDRPRLIADASLRRSRKDRPRSTRICNDMDAREIGLAGVRE